MKTFFGPCWRQKNRSVFIAIHILILAVFFVPFTWTAFWLGIGFYIVGMFGITAGYHRLLAHASYCANRTVRFLLACMGASALQKGPIWWAAHHRMHHKHTDVEGDPHSPIPVSWSSFWHSHIGWLFCEDKVDLLLVKDLTKFWELRLLEYFNAVPALILLGICWIVAGWSGVIYGFIIRTVVLYHATFCVNSVCHLLGQRRYNTPDKSRNNLVVAIITGGEGWHNNHHHRRGRARQGVAWWEIDATYYMLWILWAFSFGKLVWGLHKPARKGPKRAAA